jgi:hypothetical protein
LSICQGSNKCKDDEAWFGLHDVGCWLLSCSVMLGTLGVLDVVGRAPMTGGPSPLYTPETCQTSTSCSVLVPYSWFGSSVLVHLPLMETCSRYICREYRECHMEHVLREVLAFGIGSVDPGNSASAFFKRNELGK